MDAGLHGISLVVFTRTRRQVFLFVTVFRNAVFIHVVVKFRKYRPSYVRIEVSLEALGMCVL